MNGVLAARERAGGVAEVHSSAVQSWAAGFLQAPRDEAVQTVFGRLSGKLWKGGAHLALSRGTTTDKRLYITCWVVREGAVVLGHNCAPVDIDSEGEACIAHGPRDLHLLGRRPLDTSPLVRKMWWT